MREVASWSLGYPREEACWLVAQSLSWAGGADVPMQHVVNPPDITHVLHVPWAQVMVCANTPEEHQELLEAGCDSIYCNQNAWLDYNNLFTLRPQKASEHPSCQGEPRPEIVSTAPSSPRNSSWHADATPELHSMQTYLDA